MLNYADTRFQETEYFIENKGEVIKASDANFNVAMTVKDVITNELVDYSEYMSLYFQTVTSVNGTWTLNYLESHPCTEQDWQRFNKN